MSLVRAQFGEPTESRSKDLLFYMFMWLEHKWHRLNTHCSLRERLLICYSAVGHAEWRNVAWCHRFRYAPVKSHSQNVPRSQICSVFPCFVDFASHKSSFRGFMLAHPVRGAIGLARKCESFFIDIHIFVCYNKITKHLRGFLWQAFMILSTRKIYI